MDEAEKFESFKRKIGLLFASGEMDGADAVAAIEEYIEEHEEPFNDTNERYYELVSGAFYG